MVDSTTPAAVAVVLAVTTQTGPDTERAVQSDTPARNRTAENLPGPPAGLSETKIGVASSTTVLRAATRLVSRLRTAGWHVAAPTSASRQDISNSIVVYGGPRHREAATDVGRRLGIRDVLSANRAGVPELQTKGVTIVIGADLAPPSPAPAPGTRDLELTGTAANGAPLEPNPAANRLTRDAQSFDVTFANRGKRAERDVQLRVTLRGGTGRTIRGRTTALEVKGGSTSTHAVVLEREPKLGEVYTIEVAVGTVPGEQNGKNNTLAYNVLYQQRRSSWGQPSSPLVVLLLRGSGASVGFR